MKIQKYFTKNMPKNNNVYDMFQWKKVDICIKDQKTDSILFEGHDLEFPENYSQNACDIIAKMYFRKNGVPETGHEVSMKQVAHRMVSFWVQSMIDEKLISIGEEASIIYNELVYMLLSQMWAPNSPQWFNTGLKLAYDIEGEKSQEYYWDEKKKKVVESKDGYTRSQASACFIVGVKDSLLGDQSLMDNLTTASRLFKYGSGVGSNWSKIRAKGEKLSGGGVSSGLLSFQKVYDRNAGAIKSGGVTRRAAVMQVLDLDHPEILDFIQWKSREEDKVVALVKMGYEATLTGDAYETVSGQNVNNSISIPDQYMNIIKSGDKEATWGFTGRKDPSVNGWHNAQDLWQEICWAAWRCGDPGVQFTDTINKWNTCPNSGRINGSNPCSEFLFLDDTSCNLASINVLKFYDTKTNKFDLDGYVHAIELIQFALEATIHWGQFPTKQIAENTYKFRPTGLGLTNLGALLMYLAIPYDSLEARSIAAVLCSIITGTSYRTSAYMAETIGPFEEFKKNKKEMMKVIQAHYTAFSELKHPGYDTELRNWSSEITSKNFVNKLFSEEDMLFIHNIWKEAIQLGDKYGYRNAQVSVLAPTGTIAFAMDCESTSSEPFFSHKVYKKVVDGSWIEIVNTAIPYALKRLGYRDHIIKGIMEYIKNGDGKIEGAPGLDKDDYPIFDTASKCGHGERFLTPMAHVKMVAALTPHLSGGISKTVNLPEDATVDDIKKVYFESWRLGCKCIALYRDKCKVVQPLTTKKEEVKNENDLENMNYWELLKYTKGLQTLFHSQKKVINDLNKRLEESEIEADNYKNMTKLKREHIPYEPKCIKNAVRMSGYTFHIQRSFYDDGRLGEIFVTAGKQGDTIKGLMEVICILISKSLQYGIPVEVISDILRNTEYSPNGLVKNHPYVKSAMSITDLISKFMDMSIGDYSHCQVKPENTNPITNLPSEITPMFTPEEIQQMSDVYGADVTKVKELLENEVKGQLDKYNVPFTPEELDKLIRDFKPSVPGKDYRDMLDAQLYAIGLKVNKDNEQKEERVYGRTCTECGSKRIIKAGTCYYCQDCGSSSGCS